MVEAILNICHHTARSVPSINGLTVVGLPCLLLYFIRSVHFYEDVLEHGMMNERALQKNACQDLFPSREVLVWQSMRARERVQGSRGCGGLWLQVKPQQDPVIIPRKKVRRNDDSQLQPRREIVELSI